MKWTVRKKGDKWGVFLVQKYCKTDEPVCYGTAFTKPTAQRMVKRLNDGWKEKEGR